MFVFILIPDKIVVNSRLISIWLLKYSFNRVMSINMFLYYCYIFSECFLKNMLWTLILLVIVILTTSLNLRYITHMGQKENNANTKYNKTLTKWQRLWRANSGQGWAGKVVSIKGGILKLINFGPFYGMPKGCPDNIGFDSIIITPEMVGKRVAVFVGTEIKATAKDKLSKDQRRWRDKVIVPMGGIHREVREDGTVIESGFTIPIIVNPDK